MINHINRVLFSVVLASVLALAGCGMNPNAQIIAQVQKDIGEKLLLSETSWYGYGAYRAGRDEIIDRLVEMKDPLVTVGESEQLDSGDKANGIEWRGYVLIECKVYRSSRITIDRETKEVIPVGNDKFSWGEWKDGSCKGTHLENTERGLISMRGPGAPVFESNPIRLTIRNGQWEWCVKDVPKPTLELIRKANGA